MANPRTVERAKRRSAWALAGNVALALLALVVALVLAELVVRLAGFSYTVYVWTDPVLGMAHIPGAKSIRQSNGRPWVEINSDGWRGPEVPLAAAPGTFRIALLGDSYIEAFEVPFEGKMRFAGVAEERILHYRRLAREEARAQMDELLAVPGLPDGRVTRHIAHGYAPALIARAQEDIGADLVAIGKHGTSALEDLLLGSVTLHTLAASRCDVLVVPAKARARR